MRLNKRQLQYLNMKKKVGLIEDRIIKSLDNATNFSVISKSTVSKSIVTPDTNITVTKNSVSNGVDSVSDTNVVDRKRLRRIYRAEMNGVPLFSDYRRLRRQEYLNNLHGDN